MKACSVLFILTAFIFTGCGLSTPSGRQDQTNQRLEQIHKDLQQIHRDLQRGP